ncbi:hypothetical protein SASPL_148629 [Salvia splendens]|uniref:F-box domain-containing protein n=1 Tax=Salvia splendens TaxID=180675 RepID=A0A8X8Z4G5_SALSN|nr:hypothetical protein SASPL_148629 [Salvia splendens]
MAFIVSPSKSASNRRDFLTSLPSHLIIEILSRLPAKSLVQWKSVCKQWLDLTSDPYLAKLHFTRSKPGVAIHQSEPSKNLLRVLKAFHYPVTISLVQFGFGTIVVALMWAFNLYKRPKISGAQLAAILPLAVVHTLGNLFTNMSLGKVSVSFTHTVKAMEPFFSVILSSIFLGEPPTIWVVLSLVPVVGGVALESMTEVSFNWNLLIITVMSFILNIPVALFFMEGVKFTPSYLQAAGLNVNEIYTRSLLAALCFHAYQQVAYMILQRVSPVTHSVANCVKRVVVIVSSVLFFHTPVSLINALGTAIALAGVFLYSRVNSIKPNPKTA